MKKIILLIPVLWSLLSMAQEQDGGFINVNIGSNEEFNKRMNKNLKPGLLINTGGYEESDLQSLSEKKVVINKTIRQRLNISQINEPDEVVMTAQKAEVKYSPDKLLDFYVDLGGVDPMIAVGHNYIIVSDGIFFSFYDKNGQILPDKPGGITVSWSATDFFSWIITAANNNHFAFLKTAPEDILTKCQSEGKTGNCKELCEAYDTRVIYEPVNKRFIILSAVRNQVWQKDAYKDLCQANAVRIFAYAVSNTEDPRDGFKMWYWTKNNYRDWPRISADKDVLTVAHNGNGSDKTPAIYVISMQDLINGVAHPHWFTYNKGTGDNPDRVIPVAKYQRFPSAFDDYIMYLDPQKGDNVILRYFKKKPDMWTNKPTLSETTIDLSNDISLGWSERPVLRNGCLYFSSIVPVADEDKNVHPKVYGFDLYRLPLKKSGNDILFDGANVKKMEYPVYPAGPNGNDFTSYEVPAISVDERGTILAAYGRIAKKTSGNINPEARYFVFFENEAQHRLSKQLKGGEFMPLFKPNGWNNTTPDGFYNYSDVNDDKYIDYASVVPDPDNRFVFWIAHVFTNSKTGQYKMVVGKVAAY
jgi:hypothetical protein